MTTHKPINSYLNQTPEEFETFYFQNYERWCQSVSLNLVEYQKVLANAMINKWYNREVEKCETEFYNIIAQYPNASPEDCKRMYHECFLRMFNIFPKALLQETKKRPPKAERTETQLIYLN